MTKTSLIAIVISLAVAIFIYLYFDIRPPENDQKLAEVTVDEDVDVDNALEFIELFNNKLTADKQASLQGFFENYEAASFESEKIAWSDSIITFYEVNQQYNYAAYYHNLEAEVLNTSKSWQIAGERQFSVSQNEAYNADFNQFLYNTAIESFEKSLTIDSTNLDAKVELASMYLNGSETTMLGITSLLDVVRMDSLHLKANFLLGRFGIISKQYDKAINRLENVLSLQPENTEALFLIGEAYNGLGQSENALKYFEKCESLIENPELKKELNALIQGIKAQNI